MFIKFKVDPYIYLFNYNSIPYILHYKHVHQIYDRLYSKV